MEDFWGIVGFLVIVFVVWQAWDNYQAGNPLRTNKKCYEVLEVYKRDMLKINRCTGDTWLLLRTKVAHDDEGNTITETYGWYLIESSPLRPLIDVE